MASEVALLGFPHGGERLVYGGSVVPTAGTGWVRGMSEVELPIWAGGVTINVDVTLPTARHWVVVEWRVIITAAEDDGDVFVIWSEFPNSSGWQVRGVVGDSSTTYTLRIYYNDVQQGPDGITAIASSTSFRTSRFTWLNGQVALDALGVLEINASTSEPLPTDDLLSLGGGLSGITTGSITLRNLFIVRGDGPSDRPDEGTGFTITAIEPNSNGGHTTWANSIAAIDDWNAGGATDDDTTHIQAPDPSGKESYNPASVPTLAGSDADARALMLHCRPGLDGALASKSLGDALIYDGTSNRTVALGSKVSDGYTSRMAVFNKAPDGGDWTQADLNNLEIGREGASASDVFDLRDSALWAEFLEYKLEAGDPPPLSLIYRHHPMKPLLVR